VTLCFLGAVEEPLLPALRARAASVQSPAFELRIGQLRHWADAGVVAALADCPPEAAALAEALRSLCRELGLAPDDKPLRPHITLVRGLRGKSWRGVREQTLELRLAAGEFHLVESQEGRQAPAARYRMLDRWPLRR
jgi:2'-5' RNA ligase